MYVCTINKWREIWRKCTKDILHKSSESTTFLLIVKQAVITFWQIQLPITFFCDHIKRKPGGKDNVKPFKKSFDIQQRAWLSTEMCLQWYSKWFPCAIRPDWASLAVAAVLYWHRISHFHDRNELPPAANWQCAIFPCKSSLINSDSSGSAPPRIQTQQCHQQVNLNSGIWRLHRHCLPLWKLLNIREEWHRQLLTPCL